MLKVRSSVNEKTEDKKMLSSPKVESNPAIIRKEETTCSLAIIP